MTPWIQDAVEDDRDRDDRLHEQDVADRFDTFAPVRRDSHGEPAVLSPPPAAGSPIAFHLTPQEARLIAAAIYCAIGLLVEQGYSTTELEELRDRFLGGQSEQEHEHAG